MGTGNCVSAPISNCPTQAKRRLECATRPRGRSEMKINCPTQAKGRLEWGSFTADLFAPPSVRVFLPSTRTQSPRVLHSPSHSGGTCSIPSPADFAQAALYRIAVNVAELLDKLS